MTSRALPSASLESAVFSPDGQELLILTKVPSMIEDLYTLFRFASTLAVFWPRLLEHRRAERAPAGPSSVCQQWDLERTIKGLRRYGLSASHFVMRTSKRQFWVAYTSMPHLHCAPGVARMGPGTARMGLGAGRWPRPSSSWLIQQIPEGVLRVHHRGHDPC